MNFKRIILLALVLLVYASSAWADSFIVNKIDIRGLQRISEGTVLSYMPIKVGDSFDTANATKVIKTLYKTGFFSNVSMYRQGNTLIVKIIERPTINSIHISGNNKIKTKDLMDALKSSGIIAGQAFDVSILSEIRQALLQQYYNLGQYNANVQTNVISVTRNRVAIDINIAEGPTAKIKSIHIIGNHEFPEQELLTGFSLSRPTILTLFSKGDLYSKEKLGADLEKLRSFYFDRGYLEFNIDSTSVSITPDKMHVYIVIHITEGPVYKVGSVQLSGNLLGKRTQIQKLIDIKPGDIFSRKQVMAIVDNIKTYLGDFGYAQANVDPQIKLNKTNHLASLNLVVTPGHRVYIRHIDFFGNTKTADYVLRREMRQMEGGQFSMSALKESTQRLYNLGYIKNVQPNLNPVAGNPDQDDLQYHVKEDSSATASVQAGYSDADGFLYGGSVSEYNFLGSGRMVGVNLNNSKNAQMYSLNYYNPYYTVNNIGFGVNIFGQRTTPSKDQNMSSYSQNNIGATATYYIPMSEHNKINLGYGYEQPMLKVYKDSAQEYKDFVDKYGTQFELPEVKAGWTYSNLDRVVFPTQGFMQSVSLEASVPVFERSIAFYKASYEANWYYPLMGKYVILDTHGYFGYGGGYGKDDRLPFFENYYAGGLGSVRGYDSYSLGPKDNEGNAIGGNVSINGSFGLILPNPFGETVRTTAFVDVGDIYSTYGVADVNPGNVSGIKLRYLRSSVGIQLEWRTPMAPLVFSLAEPIHMRQGDHRYPFQFQIGASF